MQRPAEYALWRLAAARGDSRALAPSPAVLLCDEPTSALDPELSGEVVAVAPAGAGRNNQIMATHDLRLAANIASQVVF